MERSIERLVDIDKTKTGLLLAIVGIILSAVPFVPYVGPILIIIAIVLIWIGRTPFGERHSSFVKGAIALIILGVIIIYTAAVVVSSALDQALLTFTGQTLVPQSVISIFEWLLVAIVVTDIVIGVAYVLLTFDLQERSGRLELYLAFVVQLAVAILISYVIGGVLVAGSSVTITSLSTGTIDVSQIRNLQTQLQYLELAGLIPAGLFADAYYRVYSRINDGDLPERPKPLSSTSPRYMKM